MSSETAAKIDDGGPAFPVLYGQTNGADGMTLRDWFAGQALASLDWATRETPCEKDAKACYDMADAMLQERAKR